MYYQLACVQLSVRISDIDCGLVCDDDLTTRWFKYDRDYLCVNKSQFVPVIFEPPCTFDFVWPIVGL
jgi:hypothetical protein